MSRERLRQRYSISAFATPEKRDYRPPTDVFNILISIRYDDNQMVLPTGGMYLEKSMFNFLFPTFVGLFDVTFIQLN